MKTMMKGLMAVLLLIASGSVVLAGDIAVQDEPLPPEVQKLIGLKIPPKIRGRRGGDVPHVKVKGGAMLQKAIVRNDAKAELTYAEGIFDGRWPLFIVDAIYPDASREILDARLLPGDLLNWRYKNGQFEFKEGGGLELSRWCNFENSEGTPIYDGRVLIGLEDPTVQRNGYSIRIERAWEVDVQTGRLHAIPAKGMICAIIGE